MNRADYADLQQQIDELKGEIDFLRYALDLTFTSLPSPKRQSVITAIDLDLEDMLEEQLEKEMSVREANRIEAFFRGYERGQSKFLYTHQNLDTAPSRIGFGKD